MTAIGISAASFRSLGQYSVYKKVNGSCRINVNLCLFLSTYENKKPQTTSIPKSTYLNKFIITTWEFTIEFVSTKPFSEDVEKGQ